MKKLLLALVLSLLSSAALAQGCGPQNPNCAVPTAAAGTNNNRAASTAFVQAAIASGGTAGTIALAAGTITTSNPALNITQTWNSGATTFTGIVVNITNSASAAASLLEDIQVGGITKHSVRVDGSTVINASATAPATPLGQMAVQSNLFVCCNETAQGLIQTLSIGGPPNWFSYRANGTVAVPTKVLNTNTLLSLQARGAYGAGTATYQAAGTASISAVANEDWNDATHNGTDIILSATPAASATPAEVLRVLGAGTVKFSNAASFSANASVATVLGSVGPVGSHTTVQKWLTFVDSGGVTGYIPVF